MLTGLRKESLWQLALKVKDPLAGLDLQDDIVMVDGAGPSEEEITERCYRYGLYRVFREFYEIQPGHFAQMMEYPRKMLDHDILEVLRKTKEE